MKVKYFICMLGVIILFTGCAINNSGKNIVEPGIALSFDDKSVKNWFEYRELFKKYGVKATFFVSKIYSLNEDEITMLRSLEEDGHEIACHSANHLDGKAFVENNSVKSYLEHDILPAISLMKEKGFQVRSFAYPFGSRNEELDLSLLKEFLIIRGLTHTTSKIRIKDLDTAFIDPTQKDKVVYAVGIDVKYKNTLEEIREGILRAKEKSEIISLYGHVIGDPSVNDKYMTSKYLLEDILRFASENRLRFYTFSEISIFLGK